ncbi:MAG: RNA polymerase sigma factor [Sedimentisphaerales bacterium]|nr:RNA polymerase sigma factor [Sedimentisphaerales bacterium]
MQSDKYHIERCLDGHPDDFRHLVIKHQWPVTAYLAGKLRNKNDAEEAAQETFVRAYFALNNLKKHQSFNSWLIGIADRVAKEQTRNKSRFKPIPEPQTLQVTEAEPSGDFEMEQAIALLPAGYREVILLRFYAGRSCKEIAQILDMRLGTVTKTLSRAYSQLREILRKQNNEVQK